MQWVHPLQPTPTIRALWRGATPLWLIRESLGLGTFVRGERGTREVPETTVRCGLFVRMRDTPRARHVRRRGRTRHGCP